ncbi:YceI family protein [Xanthomonadaceae bacterium JHOS43]|nr:YceI family protein [Xanthomonadaceae bacterium JHOS43]
MASAQTHVIVPEHASASFWIRPVWLKRIEGMFPVIEGTAERDALSGATRVDVRIDVRALQMSRVSYIVWAQSAEFFDVEKHPWIRFRSAVISPRRLQEGGEIAGEVTLRGVTQPVVFLLEPARCARPGIDCAVRATGEVRRSAFGMDARRLALGDTVHLAFSVRLASERAP